MFAAHEGGESGSQVGDGEAETLVVSVILYPQFSSLQKEIEERTNDIESLKGEQVKLQGVIKSLEKDILGLKREIQERDETIQDKVKAHLPQPLLGGPRGGGQSSGEGPRMLGTHSLNLMGAEWSVKYLLCAWHWAASGKHTTLSSLSHPSSHKGTQLWSSGDGIPGSLGSCPRSCRQGVTDLGQEHESSDYRAPALRCSKHPRETMPMGRGQLTCPIAHSLWLAYNC